MLNQNLPASILQKDLEEYLDLMDFIFTELEGKPKIPIINNKKLMGKMHHALNVDKYSNISFRKKLLKHANIKDLEKFFYTLGLVKKDEKLKDDNIEKLINLSLKNKWEDSEATRAFVEIFDYETNLIPKKGTNKLKIQIAKSSENPLKTLTDYQSEIFFRCNKLVENKWKRFIIKMPTGAGKTRTTIEIISHFLNYGVHINEKRQIIWIADKEELCEQAIEAMNDVWIHLGNEELKIYRLWGTNKFPSFEKNSFIVATYQKLNSMLKNDQIFPSPDLIISDEAHNIIAPSHQKVLEKLQEKLNGTRIVGLTATPIRGIASQENDKLIEYFDNTIIEINSGNENPISYLQNQGFLSYCKPKTIPSKREFTLSNEERRDLERERDLPKGFLDRIARDNKRNLIIAECLKKFIDEKLQVIYFAPSVQQSKFMCALIMSLGGEAAHIDGSTPIEYRRDVISRFKNGKIKFIFNYNVFSTGFDSPNIDVVFIARPTTSIVLHQQMIGRGMRGPRMGGKQVFYLYRIADILPDIELADEYFSEIWNS